VVSAVKSKPKQLRRSRRDRGHSCWGQLVIAPLWVAYDANLGTLLRSCDAVGACLAVPRTNHYQTALARGDTLGRRRPCIHWVRPNKDEWLHAQRSAGWQLVAVELAEGAVPLTRLTPARIPTVVLLGHEHQGVPDQWVEDADYCVEIPMVGQGASLNVAVAGSLVLYRLADLV
jgi:tRNA (guanosine-2'-O-)-methyltransferase